MRVPLIRFKFGKRPFDTDAIYNTVANTIVQQTVAAKTPFQQPASTRVPVSPNTQFLASLRQLEPRFKRPVISQKEMDFIESGGATTFDPLPKPKAGAKKK